MPSLAKVQKTSGKRIGTAAKPERAMAGYQSGTATSAGSAGSAVVFVVRCSQTRPGEAVFVVGGHEALGAWKTAMALPMTTSADTFPNWQSDPVPLPAGYNVEYKFLVQKENREGPAQWQNFQGNYRVTPVTGEVLKAASDWEKASAEVSSLGPFLPKKVERAFSKELDKEDKDSGKARAKQEKEEILLKMAENAVDKAAAEVTSTCPLAVTLENREMRRRNFSQSLLALDVVTETEAKESLEAKEPKEPKEALEPTEPKKEEEPEEPKESEELRDSLKDQSESPDVPELQTEAPQEVPQAEEPDVTVCQTPEEEEPTEEPLRVPEEPARGVTLKHITCHANAFGKQQTCTIVYTCMYLCSFNLSCVTSVSQELLGTLDNG